MSQIAIVSSTNLSTIGMWNPTLIVPAQNNGFLGKYAKMDRDELMKCFNEHLMLLEGSNKARIPVPKGLRDIYKINVFVADEFKIRILSSLIKGPLGRGSEKLRVALIYLDLLHLHSLEIFEGQKEEIKRRMDELQKELEALDYLTNN